MEAIKNDILVYDLRVLGAIHDITIRELAEMFELDYTGSQSFKWALTRR
jgi:hypothetical protein